MTTTTTTYPPAESTQCAMILARLQQTPGEWVPKAALARISPGQVSHRIQDLRHIGHIIDHHNLRYGNKIHSYYRLSDSSPH